MCFASSGPIMFGRCGLLLGCVEVQGARSGKGSYKTKSGYIQKKKRLNSFSVHMMELGSNFFVLLSSLD